LRASVAAPGALSYGTATTFNVGNDPKGEYLNGDVAEVLVYNRALSDQERLQIENYLTRKYLPMPAPATPLVSVAGGTLSGPTQVAVTVPAGSLVYYTTDGSMPTTSSSAYSGPITVAYSQTIKAVAYQGALSSAVTSVGYTLDATLWPAPTTSSTDHTGPVITLQLPTNAVLQ